MTIQPPSGAEDLAAQLEQLEAERAQLEAERAEVLKAREHRDTSEPGGELAVAGAVIDPDGQEYELDIDGQVLRDGAGKPIPVGEYERDDKGVAILDDSGTPYAKWPHDSVEYKGHSFQIKKASTGAMQALNLMQSDSLPAETQNRIYHRFVDGHMSMMSRVRFMELLLSGEFEMADYRELFKLILTQGTARPTKPSRR
ncbi:hypothetical protein [Nocardia cyriacigeorgica]|uniref:hypothetical protein n=1 Tax=Nocardia cyriacigeorgica TaxID=135487 RepID=UPI001893E80B|nr:hypothetical protein [Nocardia cyriacigeorgica]MBF6417001.1 hypothetical protein [Nocardia cyriacigeorgica]